MPFQFDPLRLLQGTQPAPRQKISEILRQQRRDGLLERQEERRDKALQGQLDQAAQRMAASRADAEGAAFRLNALAESYGRRTSPSGPGDVYEDHLANVRELNAQDAESARQLVANSNMSADQIQEITSFLEDSSRRRIFNAQRATLQEHIADGIALGADSPFAIGGQIPEAVQMQLGQLLQTLEVVETPAQLLQVERMVQGVLEPVLEQQQRLQSVARGNVLFDGVRGGLDLTDPVDRSKAAEIDKLQQSWGTRTGPKNEDELQEALRDIKHPEFRMVRQAEMKALLSVAGNLQKANPEKTREEAIAEAFQMVLNRDIQPRDRAMFGLPEPQVPTADTPPEEAEAMGFPMQGPQPPPRKLKPRKFSDLGSVERRQSVAWYAMRKSQGMDDAAIQQELLDTFGVRSDQLPQEMVRKTLREAMKKAKRSDV